MLAERRLICYFEQNPPHFLSEKAESAVFLSAENTHKAKNLLGQEFEQILYDCRRGINLDTLAIAVGTLKAGGVMVLWLDKNLSADEDSLRWSGESESIATPNFYRHFYRLLEKYFPGGLLNSTCWDFQPISDFDEKERLGLKTQPTAEQAFIIEQILQSQAEMFVLTAKRGRGKSALAGLFAQRLGRENPSQKIWLTAPNKSAVKILQDFAETPLAFLSPDTLCQKIADNPTEFAEDWLFIDEAAMIPLPLLFQMTSAFKRIFCTTTIQSYEGTGRGFLLKFLPNLHRTFQHFELKRPLRWAENDPLEAFIDEILLLEAENQLILPPLNEKSAVKIFPVSQSELIERLKPFYGLLTTAHYRTSPLDLRRLLDAPKQQFWLAEVEDCLVGAVWLVEEGGLRDPMLIEQICAGSRRPKGNLVAQKLAHEYLESRFLTQSSLRISRIAVLSEWQGRGIGQQLMKHIVQQCKRDFLSVSFGYTTELAAFWQKCGFILVQLGDNREASSGCYSAMALHALGKNPLVESTKSAFERDFSLRTHPLKSAFSLGASTSLQAVWQWQEKDREKLQNFVENHRTLSSAMPALRRLFARQNEDEQAFFETVSTIKEKKAQLNALRLAVKSRLKIR